MVRCGVFSDVRIPLGQRHEKNDGIALPANWWTAHETGAFEMPYGAIERPSVQLDLRDTLAALLPAPFAEGLPGKTRIPSDPAVGVIHPRSQSEHIQCYGHKREPGQRLELPQAKTNGGNWHVIQSTNEKEKPPRPKP